MGEKRKIAEEYKDSLRNKTYKNGVDGVEEMKKDNETLKRLAEEAAKEWLEERGV